MDVQLDLCPEINEYLGVKVFHSTTSVYYAPSDLSGIGGMHREWIHATPSWKGGPGCYDYIYIGKDAKLKGFRGLHVARVRLFFMFHIQQSVYPCTLVEWFSTYGDMLCKDTGMWRVEPDFDMME